MAKFAGHGKKYAWAESGWPSSAQQRGWARPRPWAKPSSWRGSSRPRRSTIGRAGALDPELLLEAGEAEAAAGELGGSSRSRRGRRGSGDAGEAREARVGRIRARKALDGRGATDPGDGAVVKLQSHGGLHRFPIQNETERKRVENGEGEEGRERKGSTRVLLVLRQWRAGDDSD